MKLPFSHNGHSSNGIEVSPSKKPTVAVGLSGGGRKGPVHIGVLERLDEEIAKEGIISSIDELTTKSSGAMVGAGYEAQLLEYREHPDRFHEYEGPAKRLEHILQQNIDMYQLMNIWQFLWHTRDYRGFVDKRPLREFFKILTGDMAFEDIPDSAPQLKIVVHNLTTGKDIIFGEVARKTRIADALDATVAVAGFLKDEGYRGPPIYDADGELLATGEGDKLVDGGTLRKSTIRELMKGDYDFAIDVFLGRPQYPQHIDLNFPTRSVFEKLRVLKNLREDIGKKLLGDLEIMVAANSNREWHDYIEDVEMLTGFSVYDLMIGRGKGMMVVTPHSGIVTLGENGVPIEQVRIGYEAMDKAIAAYIKNQHIGTKPVTEYNTGIFAKTTNKIFSSLRAVASSTSIVS